MGEGHEEVAAQVAAAGETPGMATATLDEAAAHAAPEGGDNSDLGPGDPAQELVQLREERDKLARKFDTLRAKYDKEVPRLHAERRRVEREQEELAKRLANLESQVREPTATPQGRQDRPAYAAYLNAEEARDFGTPSDALGVPGRAVLGIVEQEQTKLKRELDEKVARLEAQMRRTETADAANKTWQVVERFLPDAKAMNTDPRFIQWAESTRDDTTGKTMLELGNARFQIGDAEGVARLMKTYADGNGRSGGGGDDDGLSFSTAPKPRTLARGSVPRPTPGGARLPFSEVKAFLDQIPGGHYGDNPEGNTEVRRKMAAISKAAEEDRIDYEA